MLIGRDKELQQLNAFFQNPSHLKITRVEGRIGSGRSALCREFARDKPSICIWDSSSTDNGKNLLKAGLATQVFLRLCQDEKLPVIRIPEHGFKSWGRFFSALCTITAATSKRLVLVLDDYANLCRADPSFGTAFESAFDSLWSTHLFVLITGTHADLAACDTPAKLDPMLAETTNAIQLRGLGPMAADLARPQTPRERIASYGAMGGFPGRYALCPSPFPETSERDRAVLNVLSSEGCPIVGLTAGQLGDILKVDKLEATRLAKDLRKRGLLEVVPCFSFSENGGEEVVERFRMADPGDLTNCNPAFASRLDWVFADMSRSWLWEALGKGDFPFEFERVGWWLAGQRKAENPLGAVGVNGHYRRIVCVRAIGPDRALDREAVDRLAEAVLPLPYKNPYCAMLCVAPVPYEIIDYASSITNLIVAELTVGGFRTISAPWKEASERYKAAVSEAGIPVRNGGADR